MKPFKNVFTLSIVSLLLLSFSNCGSGKTGDYSLTKNPPFSIEDSFYQKWVAGVQGGGSGIDVHLTFINLDEGVTIDSVYFRNKIAQARQVSQDPIKYIGNFKTNLNREVIMDIDAKKEAKNTPPYKTPFQLEDNAAVISYSINGITQYYKVSNLREKEMLAYPQSKPSTEN